jgi:hypothetical protein
MLPADRPQSPLKIMVSPVQVRVPPPEIDIHPRSGGTDRDNLGAVVADAKVVTGMAVTRKGSRSGYSRGPAAPERRPRAHSLGERRASGLDPLAGRLGGRPRLRLSGEPPLPAPRRSRLHHRRETAPRLFGREYRPVPARPLPGGGACRNCSTKVVGDDWANCA